MAGHRRDNDFDALVARAVSECLVTGDGAFRVSLDPAAAAGPILDFAGADRVEYVRRHGRVTGIDFLTRVGERGRVLREQYAPGSVRYRLEDGDKTLPLEAEPELDGLHNVQFDPRVRLAVPLMFWPSARWPGRGASVFDKKTDAFDAHDEVISQWMDAVAGRAGPALHPRKPDPPGPGHRRIAGAGAVRRQLCADRLQRPGKRRRPHRDGPAPD